MTAKTGPRALAAALLLLALPALAAPDDDSWAAARVRPGAGSTTLVPVVRDDAAPAVIEALQPLAEGGAVAAGWVLDGLALGRFVTLVMTRGDERLEAAVYPAASLVAPACTAGALAVVTQPVDAEPAVARAVCAALEGADASRVFSHVVVKPASPAPSPAEPEATPATSALARAAAWTHVAAVTHGVFGALLALLLVVGGRAARRAFTGRQLLALAGAVGVALALRLLGPEAVPLKEAYPWRGFDVITLPWPGLGVPAEPGMPVAHHAVVNLFWLSTGGALHPEQVFFAVGRGLASLAPLVLALALAAWAPSWRGPVLAAWVLALLPLHVKYAASEAATVPSTFYQAVALLALGALTSRPTPSGGEGSASGRRTPSPPMERGPGGEVCGPDARPKREALLLLFVSLWMVFLVRPENPVLAPLYPLGALALAPGRMRARVRAVLPVLAVTALALVPALLVLARGGAAVGSASRVLTDLPSLAGRLLPPHDVWLRPDLTPPWLPLAALVGAISLARRRPAGLVPLLGGLALLAPVYASIVSDVLPFGESRYQVSLAPYACALAGFGLAALAEARAFRGSRLAVPGLVVGVAAGGLHYLDVVRDAGYAPQDEFRFFRDEVRPRLEAEPPACPYLLVPTGDARYKDAEGDDFVQVLRKPPGLAVIDRRGLQELAAEDARPSCALFWRGLFCYRARSRDDAVNPECAAILGAPGVTPLVERTVPNRPYHREVDPVPLEHPTLTFGLYRVELPLGAE